MMAALVTPSAAMGAVVMTDLLRSMLFAEQIIHDGGECAHDQTVRTVVPAPAGTARAVGQQRIHDAQLLADGSAAEDGGMLIDFEEGQRSRRRRSSAVGNVQTVRM